jgi:hypothetical protein
MGHGARPKCRSRAPASWKMPPPAARLEVRRKPYYATISPAIQLGYRRNIGGGSWSVRCIGQGADWIKKIALADDLEPADGKHVLTYWQAIDVARALARSQPGADDANRPVTVGEALDRYQRDLESRGADAQNANRVRRHLTPTLATKPVALLTITICATGVMVLSAKASRLQPSTEPARVCAPRWNWPRRLMIASPTAMLSGQASRACPAARTRAAWCCQMLTCCASCRPHIKRIEPSACWSRYSRRLARASRRPRGCAALICRLIERTRAC